MAGTFFAGRFEGARRAALLYSLVQSCKLVDVPPFDYLKDVLKRIATHPQRLIGQLTPKAWAETFHRPNFLVATSHVSWRGRGIRGEAGAFENVTAAIL
jgi:transposase IS66-like protein